MKEINAIIRPEKLNDVVRALERAGYPRVSVMSVDGKGREVHPTETWRGEAFKVLFSPKLMIRVFVKDSHAMSVVDAILESAKTGVVGDGKIVVKAIDQVYRIRTGESGEAIL